MFVWPPIIPAQPDLALGLALELSFL